MNGIPAVKSVMSPFPYSIGFEAPLSRALVMMYEHGIRHLPVKREEKLVGVVNERDVQRVLGGPEESVAGQIRVRDVMIGDPYIVDLNERLDVVLLHLSRRRVDCALVVKDDKLAGIFTTRDACRIFGEHLRKFHAPEHGDDAA